MRMNRRSSSFLAVILLAAAMPRLLQAEARVETNVIYGMYSGLALLMDVYYAADPNGYGIVLINGSGWQAPLSLDARPLKGSPDRPSPRRTILVDAGYTLFSINHRAAPRFRYPAPVEDAQRAVRYVRHHAASYGIDPNRIGAIGGSSGGHLASMLGVLDGDADPETPSPVDQESSKVQTVVAWYPGTDFIEWVRGGGRGARFLGANLSSRQLENEPNSAEARLYREASPTSYVSADDPPFLLIHGDQDDVVPFTQSELFRDKLANSGVTVELIRVPGGGHGYRGWERLPNVPEHLEAMVAWFDRHLRSDH